jgi:hypothetical protein
MEALDIEYKVGDRIQMVLMSDDPHPIKPGTTGTVTRVNRLNALKEIQLSVTWDKPSEGRSLMVLLPYDRIMKI